MKFKSSIRCKCIVIDQENNVPKYWGKILHNMKPTESTESNGFILIFMCKRLVYVRKAQTTLILLHK